MALAIVATVGLALALLAVVAISNGHLTFRGSDRAHRAIDVVNRHLNGEGTPPRFLERLDQPRSR